jgi:hypothetical protein
MLQGVMRSGSCRTQKYPEEITLFMDEVSWTYIVTLEQQQYDETAVNFLVLSYWTIQN